MDKSYVKTLALEMYRNELCKSFHHLLRDLSILDVGCGDGKLWIKHFSKVARNLVGVDVNFSRCWKEVGRFDKVNFVRCDAKNLPFRSSVFDLVFEKDTLHHVGSSRKMLNEMFRTSKSLLIVIEANRYHPLSYIHMVKVRGHDHLSQNSFKSLVFQTNTAKKVLFETREVHYVPTKSIILLRILWIAMHIFEKIPLTRNLQSYNVVLLEK